MNIALNPETAADKSCQTYPKTIGQFEALTFPEAAERRVPAAK